MITADLLPQPQEQRRTVASHKPGFAGRINESLEAFRFYLDRCGLAVRCEKTTDNGTCLILSECPMHPEHGHGTDTAIVYHTDGSIGFECKHNGCAAHTWQDVRKHIDPAWTGPAEDVDMNPVLMEPTDLIGHYNLTDLGNAERFALRHGQDIRYVRGDGDSGDFYIWDGSRWIRDCQGEVMRRARETTRSIYHEVASEECDGDRRQIRKHAVKSESERSLRAMVELVTSDQMVAISTKALDTDPWLLNCQNGTVDLRTEELRPARRDDHCTKLAPVVYAPQAACPRWDQFMIEIMNNDPELVGYLQRLAGMWLTGEINEHVFPVFYGEGPNGKNTMLDAVQAIMGDYADTAPDTLISVRSAQTHPADKAKLWGKRLVIASETDEGDKLRVSHIKNLTGDTFISARFMRRDFFTFRRTHKIVLMTNHKPKIPDQTHSIWRRVKLVPFTVQFTGNKEDKKLAEKLKGEYSGILNWLIRGCLDWQQFGLNEPASITQATAQYRHDEDTFSLFVDECLEQSLDHRATRLEVKHAYKEWAKRSGEQDLPARILYARLRQRGYADIEFRENGGVPVRGFSGIRVRPLKDPEAPIWEPVSS